MHLVAGAPRGRGDGGGGDERGCAAVNGFTDSPAWGAPSSTRRRAARTRREDDSLFTGRGSASAARLWRTHGPRPTESPGPPAFVGLSVERQQGGARHRVRQRNCPISHTGEAPKRQTECPARDRHLPSVAIYARPPKARYNKLDLIWTLFGFILSDLPLCHQGSS